MGYVPNQHCSVHAEVSTYYRINRGIRRSISIYLFVLRKTSSGIVMSKPCERCQQFIRDKNVHVFYTDITGNIVKYGKPATQI